MISILRDKILNITGMEWLPMVIVANKLDLHPQRQVSTQEGLGLSVEWKCSFIETSAKHNQNIGKIFELILSEIEKVNSNEKSGEICVLL